MRKSGNVEGAEDAPSSVGFAVYLVDVQTGQRLWRGHFDGTQKILTDMVIRPAQQGSFSVK